MNKNYRLQTVLSSIFIILTMIAGLLARFVFDKKITAISGTEQWKAPALAMCFIPIIFLIINLVCIFITLKDNKKGQSSKVINMVFWICPIVSILPTAVTYALILHIEINYTTVLGILIGALFVFMGNYMPKCKQNRTIGIRVKWALDNEENWNKTHRFGGKVYFIGGIAFMLASILNSEAFIWVLLSLTLAIVLIPTLYSYLYYKKQVKSGTWTTENKEMISKKTSAFVLVFVALTLIFCAIVCFTGEVNITLEEKYINVEASYYSDIKINYDKIQSIEYREIETGERIMGFGTARLLLGSFKNDEFGIYTRYTYGSNEYSVIITTESGKTVLGMKTEEETKELYKKLLERTAK